MPQLVDLYFLVNKRSPIIVQDFLNFVLPDREESSTDYPFPQYLEATKYLFNDVNSLIEFIEENPTDPYSLYWRNTNETDEIKHAMALYTDDGNVIFGVSIAGKNPYADDILVKYKEIKSFLLSDVGCTTVDEVPPLNSVAFEQFSLVRSLSNKD